MRYPGILQTPHDISYLSVDSRSRGRGRDTLRSVDIRGSWRDSDRSRAYLSDVFGRVSGNGGVLKSSAYSPIIRSASLGPKRVAFKDFEEFSDYPSRSDSKVSTTTTTSIKDSYDYRFNSPVDLTRDYNNTYKNQHSIINNVSNGTNSSHSDYHSYRNISNYEVEKKGYFKSDEPLNNIQVNSPLSDNQCNNDNGVDRGITTVTYHDDDNDAQRYRTINKHKEDEFDSYDYKKNQISDQLFKRFDSRAKSYNNLNSFANDNHRYLSQFYFEKAYNNIKSELNQLQSPFYGHREYLFRSPRSHAF